MLTSLCKWCYLNDASQLFKQKTVKTYGFDENLLFERKFLANILFKLYVTGDIRLVKFCITFSTLLCRVWWYIGYNLTCTFVYKTSLLLAVRKNIQSESIARPWRPIYIHSFVKLYIYIVFYVATKAYNIFMTSKLLSYQITIEVHVLQCAQ